MDNKILAQQYKEMGARWLAGEFLVEDWQIGEKKIIFNDKQKEFVNDKTRFSLISGGFSSGKTLALLFKTVLLALWFPGNRILLGRRTRTELEKVTLPDFFDICPPEWVEYRVGPGIIKFFNGSEIILFGLDALQNGSSQDIKKAEQELKSLNLGGFVIDQLEEIEERVFQALRGRLRRDVGFRQGIMSTNPANFWAYDYFKANPRESTRLIEVSTLENKKNLPPDYLQDLLNNPKNYVERYVHGTWSPDVMTEASVFAKDYILEQAFYIQEPIREFDGIKIYQEPKHNEEYQIGADPSEGAIDPCCIKVVSKTSGEEVASFSGFVPTSVQVNKLVQLANMYSINKRPLIVVEANASGTAVIESLKMQYDNIYEREVFNYQEQRSTRKLGFVTSDSTKKLLIEHFNLLLRSKFAKIRDKETQNEMKTFIYSNEARMKGAGAQTGFHDDRVMATMLAYFRINPMTTREKNLFKELEQKRKNKKITYQFS
jgi:hypothetical protein